MPSIAHSPIYPLIIHNKRAIFFALCYATIFAISAYRGIYIFEHNPMDNIFSDPERHWAQGIDTLRFDPMAMTDPIIYQLFIGMLAKLTLKDHALTAFYITCLCVFTPWVWYRFLRELLDSKVAATCGWLLLSLIPSWISIYAYFMQETLLLPLLGLALWSTWRCRRTHALKFFLGMIVFWSLAGLTRGIVIPMAAVACTWVWLEQNNKLIKALCSVSLLAFILGPLAYRSYQIVHIIAPHGMGNMNYVYAKSGKRAIEVQYEREGARWGYIFQSPAAQAKPLEPLSHWQSSRRGKAYIYIDLDEGNNDWQTAYAKYPLNLKQYAQLTFENMILLFFSESWPDSNRNWTLGAINYHTRWLWAPLTCVIIVVSIAYRRKLANNKLLASLLLTWFITQCLLPISVNEGRYRMPLYGLLIAQGLLLTRNSPSKTANRQGELPLNNGQ